MVSTPPQDQSDLPIASRLLSTSLGACILASICVAARLWFRFRISRLGTDDFLILAALMLSIVSMFLALSCLDFAGNLTFAAPRPFLRMMFFFYDVHIWTVVTIKTSLAFMILRFHQDRAWRLALYTLIVVQAMVAFASTFTNYLRCTPIKRAWEGDNIDGHCISEQGMRTWMWMICAFSIATDVFYTIIPLTDILRLDRSLRERLALCALMSVSLLATVASVIKTSVVSFAFNDFGDTHSLSDLMLCSLLEIFLGIMGACLPCFKHRFERALYWTKRRTILFWDERVHCGDSLGKRGQERDGNLGEARESSRPLGLRDSSASSENSVTLPPVLPESRIMLDGYITDKEGQWRWSTSQAFEIPMFEQVAINEGQIDDCDRTEDDARRTVDSMFHDREKPLGWEEMESGLGIKRIWAERSRRCHS